MNEPTVSILLCTRNRCIDLRETLCALVNIDVPRDLSVELIVIDNGSTDATADVVRNAQLANMPIRYVWEPVAGQARARNAGLAVAKGRYILFTDDDVRPPANWIAGMCAPLRAGECEAVAGGVRIAPHLLRDWMSKRDRAWLASTERIDPKQPTEFVGANFAVSRDVLRHVPRFDESLGPGALGFGDDSMFCWQIQSAGLRVGSALHIEVEHHFDPLRLSRASFLDSARRMGATQGHLLQTWFHREIRFASLRAFKSLALLAILRLTCWPDRRREGISELEGTLVTNYHVYRTYARAVKTSRQEPVTELQVQWT